jgi:SNF2 family DNA or RNA helicase
MANKPVITAHDDRWSVEPVNADMLLKLPGIYRSAFGAIGHRDAVAVLWKRLMGKAVGHLEVPLLEGTPEMRDYQVKGVSWLVAHLGAEHGALLADDMGLGKTMQTVMTWQALGHPSLLIVCPASVRRGWVRELKKWGDADAILVEKGSDWAKYDGKSPVVTSYQLAQQCPEEAFFDFLVIDEIQNARGRGAKQSRYLLDLSKQATYRLGLTGTPMWSRPNDLWMVLHILFPRYRFGTADEFDIAYCNAFWNKWGGKVNKGISNEDELSLRLKYVMLRRTKQDVKTDLPPVTRMVRYVEPSKKASLKLRMAMVGSCSLHDALLETLENKLDTVVETVVDSGTNCLVFTWMKEHAHRLKALIDKATKGECLLITGDLTHKQRDLVIQTAAKTKQTIVATLDSCGVGVDGLQHVTSNVVYHALDYVPIKTSQSLARIDRIGQKDPVTATFVVQKDSADDLVMATVVEKLDQWLKVMGKDDNTSIRDTLVDSKQLAKMGDEVLKAMYESFGG